MRARTNRTKPLCLTRHKRLNVVAWLKSMNASSARALLRYFEICHRMTMNPNKNHSQVTWDCYDRPCRDQPSAAAAAAVQSSSGRASVAAADEVEKHERESSAETCQLVCNDDQRQTVTQVNMSTVCSCTCSVFRHVYCLHFVIPVRTRV